MPQWRKLHVKTVDSLDVNDMPDDFTRLLWVVLPLGLDSKGRGLDNTSWVKARTMPLREDVTGAQIGAALDWFAARGMIERYEVAGRRYFYLPTWRLYQGDTSRETDSVIPEPDVVDAAPIQEQVTTGSRPAHDLLTSNSRTDSDADADSETDSDAEGKAAPQTATETPSPKPRKRAGKPANPPTPKPPAVLVYQSVTRRYPDSALWEGIAQVVGTDQPKLDFWRQVITSWLACGYNPKNVKGMLECFHDGALPSTGGNGGRKPPARSVDDDGTRYVTGEFAEYIQH